MKARPILFSPPMVKALLEGRKTQTRRVAKGVVAVHARTGEALADIDSSGERVACPYGQQGDLLYVRETWAFHVHAQSAIRDEDGPFAYAADSAAHQYRLGTRWTPSIHMPRWASRLTLRITGVRVERLQEISETDAIVEGIERVGGAASCNPWRNYRIGDKDEMSIHCSAPSRSYMTLWESINGPGSWDANPWAWVVSFEVIKANVDAVLKEAA